MNTPAAGAIFTHLLLHERMPAAAVAALENGEGAIGELTALGLVEPEGDGYRLTAWARERFPLGETGEPDPGWIGGDLAALVRGLRRAQS